MRIISKLLPASRIKLVISCIGVLALLVFASIVLFEATKAEVVITDNGEKQTVKTHQETVEGLLEEVGIVVGEHDALSHRADAAIENGMKIDYKTAMQIFVTVDGDEQVYYTTAGTIKDFLSEHRLSFTDQDDVSYEATDATGEGLHIEVTKAYQVTINDGGKEKKVWTTGGTVGELLDANKIRINKKLDKVKPAIKKDLTKDTSIKIVRVEKVSDKVTENVAFDTVTKEDSTLEKGKKEVTTKGQEGRVVKEFEVTLEDGKEVNRELVSEKVKEESKSQVVAIGTKEAQPKQEIVQLSASKPKEKAASKSNAESKPESKSTSGDSYGKVLQMSASAYTGSCSGCSGYTATGINLNANPNMKVIAVDPNVIPLGSRVWVEGYGEAIAGDTGGSIVGNRIDVHVPSKAAAKSWGRKTVTVKVIN